MDVGNLISGSSAFSKSSLNICKFSICWSLAWRILSITLLQCEVSAIGRVMVESSDKTWSIGEENGKPLQYSVFSILATQLSYSSSAWQELPHGVTKESDMTWWLNHHHAFPPLPMPGGRNRICVTWLKSVDFFWTSIHSKVHTPNWSLLHL